MTTSKMAGIWLALLVLILSWLCIHLDSTPTGVDRHSDFSVPEAMGFLGHLAVAPHSFGTEANERVRSYIDSSCQAIGLDVEDMPFTLSDTGYHGMVMARGRNVIATLHGHGKGKKILVMGHMDSEPNSLGAGDDGSACAAMLESAKALKAGTPLDRDVVFLFTNGEENGMLGATAFARDSMRVHEIGLVLNFDGRGDKGRVVMFRTSPDNRHLVEDYARAKIPHAAGSLYGDLFHFLPNNTDFTPLENAGVPGLDFAFTDGFEHYHNLTDNLENMDRGTMQDQGDNMLGAIRYFANSDLSPAQGNATFFDLHGGGMVVYGMGLNRALVYLANGCVLFALVFGFYRKRIKVGQTLLGLLAFLVTLTVLFFLESWTLAWIRSAYPLYENYYPNAYNSGYFYIALAAEGVCAFSLLYLWPLRKWSMPSLFMSVLLLETVLLDFLYPYIPGGVYFFYFPLIFAGALFPYLGKSWSNALSLLPAIFLMTPLYAGLVSLLDVEKEAAITAPLLGLFLGLAIPVISRCPRWFIPGASFLVFMAFMGWGLLHGGYDAKHPYKTDLRYYVDADNRSAYLVTHETKPDNWNRRFFHKYFQDTSAYQYPGTFFAQPREFMQPTEFIDLDGPRLVLQKDTVLNGRRRLLLHCQVPKEVVTVHLSFEPDVALFDYPGDRSWMDYIHPPDEGFDILVDCTGPLHIRVISRTMGIPSVGEFRGYPDGVIPTPSGFANTTMVGRKYTF